VTLTHLADIVGPEGAIFSWRSGPFAPQIGLGDLHGMYTNIFVDGPFVGGRFYEPRELDDIYWELIVGTFGRGNLSLLQGCKDDVLPVIIRYLGASHLNRALSSLLIFYPDHLSPLNSESIVDYEQFLMQTLQPVCRLAKARESRTYSIALFLKFEHDLDEGGDLSLDSICEKLIDVIAEFGKPDGRIRPKEQLRINSKYMHGMVLLALRYRKL
jgi:hypothetical protein